MKFKTDMLQKHSPQEGGKLNELITTWQQIYKFVFWWPQEPEETWANYTGQCHNKLLRSWCTKKKRQTQAD